MGVVYEATDEELGTTVALKTIRLGNAESIARLKREFRALQDLRHPNLVSLGELVTEGEECFFTMEFVKGVDFVDYVSAAGRDDAPPATDDAPVESRARSIRRRRSGGDGALYDDERLRRALVQLAEGLGALHANGMIHRDIKPANVLVASGGRVVLLDFGLVASTEAGESIGDEIVGTPEYMAPEQAASSMIGPEADWYSVGVMLYEALTGHVPFEGGTLEVLSRKQNAIPPAPSTLSRHVAPDLDALALDLLHPDPGKRLGGNGLLARLGVKAHEPAPSQTLHVTFVGRTSELGALDHAFQDSHRGAVVTLVRGESGVGKTALVRRFAERLTLEEHRMLVLSGRCYERETVAYKAVDGVIDALARVLSRMSSGEAGAYLPTRIEPLLQVFPVLRRVDEVAALARQSRPESAQMDQIELRSRAFGALREMLGRIAVRRPVLITIDDLQWADSDSVALLTDVFRMPEAPPLLLIATVRTGTTNDASTRLCEALARMGTEIRELDVSRLSSEEGRELASALLERTAPDKSKQLASALADEAEGHPLFIDALVRHAMVTEGERAHGAVRLEDALWSRVASFEPAARELIELLAVAGRPLPQEVLAKAAEADRGVFLENVALLRVAHLVTITGSRGRDTIDTYHDKVRAAVTAHLDDEGRERRHRRLALALETAEVRDPDALYTHWRGAKDVLRAAKYAEEAADRAVPTLAFEHAATLYEAAIELGGPTGEARRTLEEKLGDTLASAGRCEKAARAYGRASEGANAARALDLKRRAADQLLRTGQFDAGLDAVAGVLASIGMSVPRSPIAALLSFLTWRIVLWFRGLEFKDRDASLIEPHRLTQIDVCFSVATGLSCTDTIRGRGFSVRALLLALDAGERSRVALTLSMEIPYVATGGHPARGRTEALIRRGTELARSLQTPRADGQMALTVGVSRYLLGDFRLGLELLDKGNEILTTSCSGVTWEIDTAQFFTLNCLAYLGELAEMCRRAPEYLHMATERGDVYGATNLRIGLANIAWLVRDDPDGSRREVTEAMRAWSKRGFHLEHFYELSAITNTDLYAGNAVVAYDRVRERWPALRRSMLMRIQLVRIAAWGYRARSALAYAALGGPGAEGKLREGEADAERLEKERTPWASPLAKLLRAGALALRTSRSDPRVVALLREAERGFAGAEMKLFLAATRARLGAAVGGEEGRGLEEKADAWLRNETVKAPERLVAMLTPGLGESARG
jgi:tetratricopeptide (TPR) repeat protein